MLAGNEYLKRHDKALKLLMTTWAVKYGLLEKGQCRYKLKWEQEMIIENDRLKLRRDFEYRTRKETIAQRPVVTLNIMNLS